MERLLLPQMDVSLTFASSRADAEATVLRLYRLMLRRDVDEGARADKVSRLAANQSTVAELIEEIASSAEYLALGHSGSESVSASHADSDGPRPIEPTVVPTVAAAGETIRRIGRLLTPRAAVGQKKVRVGGDGDGGYVMLDDFAPVRQAFSLGVGDDVSWDLAVAERGIVVHQFDYSIARPPVEHPNFRFHRLRIGSLEIEGAVTLAALRSFAPLATDVDEPTPQELLKIDIEHDEWDAFLHAHASDLSIYRQIIGEFHWFNSTSDAQWSERAMAVLERLDGLFQCVHVHANNWAPMLLIGGVPFPAVLEVTFANRSVYDFVDATETFPTPLDRPNNIDVPDVYLGRFEF